MHKACECAMPDSPTLKTRGSLSLSLSAHSLTRSPTHSLTHTHTHTHTRTLSLSLSLSFLCRLSVSRDEYISLSLSLLPLFSPEIRHVFSLVASPLPATVLQLKLPDPVVVVCRFTQNAGLALSAHGPCLCCRSPLQLPPFAHLLMLWANVTSPRRSPLEILCGFWQTRRLALRLPQLLFRWCFRLSLPSSWLSQLLLHSRWRCPAGPCWTKGLVDHTSSRCAAPPAVCACRRSMLGLLLAFWRDMRH